MRYLVRAGLLVSLLALTGSLLGAEGMWMPSQIPDLQTSLEAHQIRVPAETLADLQRGPAAAVFYLMGGTGSFVSPQGLIMTNHHVAYDALQMVSTVDRDLLAKGFLARTRAEELSAPGYRLQILHRQEEITREVQDALQGEETPAGRAKRLERVIKERVAACEQRSGLRCEVKSFDHGLRYYELQQLELRDLRLVQAPPSSVGDYGGEIDNFEWPRHSGDFAFLRAYVGPDGKPADFAPQNVPYQPPVWLKQASAGVQEGDALMIFGYPWTTSRYQTAARMSLEQTLSLPQSEAWLRERVRTLEETGRQDRERALLLASELANLGNGLKLISGKRVAMAQTQIVQRRAQEEAALQQWIEADPERKQKYGAVLPALNALVEEEQKTFAQDTQLRRLFQVSPLLDAAETLLEAAEERAKPDLERRPGFQSRDLAEVRAWLEYLRPDVSLEQKSLALELVRALELPKASQLEGVASYFPQLRPGQKLTPAQVQQVERQVAHFYAQSRLDEAAHRLALFDGGPTALKKVKDPLIQLARSLRAERRRVREARELHRIREQTLLPRLLAARQAREGGPHYPDANGTLRFTLGRVEGVSPADGVQHAAFTYARGITEKHTGEEPYNAPTRLLQAAQAQPDQRVNFIGTVDTTGGNSGSPVMNTQGALVGLLFDGNRQSTADEFVFWPEKQRSVMVDLRYIQWYLDRVDGAQELLNELGWKLLP